MREQQLAEAVGQDDLAGMEMPRQDQVPATGRHRLERPWEMAEKDPEAGVGGGKTAAALLEPGARVDTGDLDLPDTLGRVEEQRSVLEAAEVDRARERVARAGMVVVPEHDVGMRQLREEREQPEDERQISSFSRTGLTDTTCRLNFSSDSSSPAATPTSCER